MSLYEPGDLLSAGDVLDAVYDFLLAYVRPVLSEDRIVRGWENRGHLPPATNDYAVISVSGTRRIGTTVVEDPLGEDDLETLGVLRRIDVQVDFCSHVRRADQMAATAEAVFRSDVGVSFFADYGLSALYAEDVASVEYQDGSGQMVHRNILNLHLSGWLRVAVGVGHAIRVEPRVENVDVHHPVNRGE